MRQECNCSIGSGLGYSSITILSRHCWRDCIDGGAINTIAQMFEFSFIIYMRAGSLLLNYDARVPAKNSLHYF